MPLPSPDRIRAIAEVWESGGQAARLPSAFRSEAANLREFAEVMNAQTRLLIAELQVFDPGEWDRLAAIFRERDARGESIVGGIAFVQPEHRRTWLLLGPHFIHCDNARLISALEELCTHAVTMCSSAKFFVDKLDRTAL